MWYSEIKILKTFFQSPTKCSSTSVDMAAFYPLLEQTKPTESIPKGIFFDICFDDSLTTDWMVVRRWNTGMSDGIL